MRPAAVPCSYAGMEFLAAARRHVVIRDPNTGSASYGLRVDRADHPHRELCFRDCGDGGISANTADVDLSTSGAADFPEFAELRSISDGTTAG